MSREAHALPRAGDHSRKCGKQGAEGTTHFSNLIRLHDARSWPQTNTPLGFKTSGSP